MSKKIIYIVAAIIILAVGIFAGIKIPSLIPVKREMPIAIDVDEVGVETVEKIIEETSELVATNYSYKDIYKYEKSVEKLGIKIPFSTNQFILSYSGTVKGGIDFSKIGCSVDNESKTITLKMPAPYIISHEIDEKSIEYFDVKKSLFEKYSLTDYTKLIGDLKEKKNAELLKDKEFTDSVTENSQNILKSFLLNSNETSNYTVVFK